MAFIRDYFIELVTILNQMSPYLLLGFFLAGLLHVLIPQRHVVHYLGGNNLKSVIYAALIGVPFPLCSCGVVPTGLSFHKNGASKGSSVSFLISTPQTGPDSMMVTYSMLGLPFAIIRPFVALITGIIGGWVTNQTTKNEVITKDVTIAGSEAEIKYKNPLKELFRYAFVDFLQDISKWLIIGIFIAAFIAVLIPDNFLTASHGNWVIGMLFALLISGPMYVCATGSVPIAAILMMKGLSPGAALVFLMAGPATNAATISMIGKVLGKKSLFTYLTVTIVGALFFGILIDVLLPTGWLIGGMNMNHTDHDHGDMLPAWLQITSSLTLGLFILNAFRLKYLPSRKKIFATKPLILKNMETKTVMVQGMTCNHCKATVENNLRTLPGIKEVEADLQSESVIITADIIDLAKIKSTVEGLGYKYAGEKN